jgi:hypothetical protein
VLALHGFLFSHHFENPFFLSISPSKSTALYCFTTSTMDKRSKNDYFSVYFPLSIQDDLKAAAFASLCDHLRQKPSEVSNIEMMSVGGFCRNCLAKWLVMTARKLSVQVKVASLSSAASKSNPKSYMNFPNGKLVELLDTFGYDEAAQRVYGCAYTEWKATYQKTATEAQL